MMTATRICLPLALVITAVAVMPRSARAQSAEAEALFQEGKRLMKNGEVAQACDKFDAADHVEPTAGNELNLARCRETNGQFATAWAIFLKAAATAKHAGDPRREGEARKQAAALEPRLGYLTISVPDESRVPGLVIKRNDVVVDEALWEQHVPIDPAAYIISGEAPGYKPWSSTVVVTTKSKKVQIPLLEKRIEVKQPDVKPDVRHDTTPRPVPGDVTPPSNREPDQPIRAESPSGFTSTRRTSIIVGAVGVAVAGVGLGLGYHARDLENQSDATCPDKSCAVQAAVDLNKSARRYALAANVGFAAGGAAVVGAVILWFVGGPKSQETVSVIPTLDADHVGITYARSF